MKFILKIIISILNFIFYFMKLLPVQNKIVYISRQSNQKSEDMALLEAAIYRLESTSLKQVFLCKKFDGNIIYKFCYGFHMLKQMYHLATAKIVVLDSYCIAVSVLNQRSSLVVIQMWHALGALKKFGLSIVDKKEGRTFPIEAKYVGFEIPNAFVIGFGLDFDEKYRNLPYVGILKEECYQ